MEGKVLKKNGLKLGVIFDKKMKKMKNLKTHELMQNFIKLNKL